MLLDVRHSEDVILNSRCGLVVPWRLDEAAANPVDFSKGVQITDIDFIWFDPHHRPISPMKVMDVENTLTRQYFVLQNQTCEP